MRGRFILGFSRDHSLGSKGGEETHQLKLNEMPSHGHTGGDVFGTKAEHGHTAGLRQLCGDTGGNSYYQTAYSTDGNGDNTGYSHPNGAHEHNVNPTPKGNNVPHNNMPPFVVLTYIIKL